MTPSVSRAGRRRRMISTTHDHQAKPLLSHSHNVPVTIGTVPEIARSRRSDRITFSNAYRPLSSPLSPSLSQK